MVFIQLKTPKLTINWITNSHFTIKKCCHQPNIYLQIMDIFIPKNESERTNKSQLKFSICYSLIFICISKTYALQGMIQKGWDLGEKLIVSSKTSAKLIKQEKNQPIIQLLHWKNEIEHHSFPYQSIKDSKSEIPSKLTDVYFSFYSDQDEHRAPSKSLNDQGNHLPEK